ncbi:MAG: AAA domain-containing protein [Cytophagales bacterium]|nr:AAA domain-containing protein [Cytophagales bacterium]
MVNILKIYQNKLVNLTGTNRALNLLKLSPQYDVDFYKFQYIMQKSAFEVLEDVFAMKKIITLCDYANPRDPKSTEVSNSLHKIYRRQLLALEEKGTHDLQIGYPMLRGKFNNGIMVSAPLLFFSYSIDIQNNNKPVWRLVLREDTPISVNKSLLLAWSHHQRMPIHEEYWDELFDTENIDSLEFRNRLYYFLKESGIEINFNRDLYVNTLQPFTNYTKDNFETVFSNGELKLFPEAVLGMFPEAGSVLYTDYDNMLTNYEYNNFEDFFISKSLPKGLSVKEENIKAPFAVDGAQREAVCAVKNGNSIVIQGPPGSGKSQLISNLACDYMAQGKKVLIVCQKRVALDVVQQRLKSKYLHEFVAVVHDTQVDRRKIYDQIASQIQKIDLYKEQNYTLNAIILERDYLQICRNIDAINDELTSYKYALFETNTCEVSAKELYIKTKKFEQYIYLNIESCNYNNYEKYVLNINYIYEISVKKISNNVLKYLIFHEKISLKIDKNTLIKHLNNYYQLTKIIFETSEKYLKNILEICEHATRLIHYKYIINNIDNVENIYAQIELYLTNIEAIDEYLYNLENIDNTLQILEKLIENPKNIIAQWVYVKYNIEGKLIYKYLNNRNISINKNDIKKEIITLKNLIILKKNLKLLLFQIDENYTDISSKNEVVQYINTIKNELNYIIKNKNIYIQIFTNNALIQYENNSIKIEKYIHIINEKITISDILTTYFSPDFFDYISSLSKDEYIKYTNTIDAEYPILAEYENQYFQLTETERANYHILSNSYAESSVFYDFKTYALQSGYRSFIKKKEELYPILTITATGRMDYLIQQLQDLLLKKQDIVTQMLLIRIRAQTYKNIEVNRLNNRVTYRDLQHQVTKKKKIWKPRKLLETFENEIYNLVPCWLCSPESVSTLFPCRQIFDIVIFDEASQCFVEKSIPSMWRATQIVVVGDSKQLAPFDLYNARWEQPDHDDTPMEADTDSALALCEKYLPSYMLTGHYRSKHPALIAFSNTHFYEGKLTALPDREVLNSRLTPIIYVQVNGIWHKNQNMAEAEKVIQIIIELSTKEPDKEIGVVTFNIHQKNLIEDLLTQNNNIDTSNIYVKNIENIQGDERDYVIFSVGYAPDHEGKIKHQFGSLSHAHGENRLNVAVTRARSQVIVVASITPSQLQTQDLANEGPKLLKKYLEYAWNVSQGSDINTNLHENTELFSLKHLLTTDNYKYKICPYPMADVAEYEGDMIQKLIFTDDEAYRNNPSMIDCHGYKPIALKHKNWDYEYIWSREYSCK